MPTASSTAGEIVGLAIQNFGKRVLNFITSGHLLCTTYVSGRVELAQPPVVVMANTGDSPVTTLQYYAKLSEGVMRRFVEGKPVIPSARG